MRVKNDQKQIVFGWKNLFDSKILYFFFLFIFLFKLSIRYETVDINIAINTDAGVLMTPILYNVDQKVELYLIK